MEEPTIVGNHLSIPKPMDMNPNLLSPEVLGQRRGNFRWFQIKSLEEMSNFFIVFR